MTTCSCSNENFIYKKRDKTILFTISGIGDITGGSVWFSVKQDLSDSDDDAIIRKRTTDVGGAAGEISIVSGYIKETDSTSRYYKQYVSKVEVNIVPDDTENATPGDYACDFVVKTPGGKTYEVVKPQRFEIRQPVTMT